MASVFKVMYEADPDVAARVGASATELAVATAAHCFNQADQNGDGKLTLEVCAGLGWHEQRWDGVGLGWVVVWDEVG